MVSSTGSGVLVTILVFGTAFLSFGFGTQVPFTTISNAGIYGAWWAASMVLAALATVAILALTQKPAAEVPA